MRLRRIREDGNGHGAYYHLMNRVPGTAEDRPLDDVDKEKFVEMIHLLGGLYTTEVIGYCVMSNHFHLVLWAPAEDPSEAEVVSRWKKTFPKRLAPDAGSPAMKKLQGRLRDISEFMKDLQMRFTCWYNRTRPIKRTGPLWGKRFTSVVLEGTGTQSAVWDCMKYVELNPVRARLVADPADYRWSSWGRFCGSGKHPFHGQFMFHMKRTGLRLLGRLKSAEVTAEFRGQMAAVIAREASGDPVEVAQAKTSAKAEMKRWVRADRRVRFWSDGVAIGSKAFVRDVYARAYNEERAKKHRFAQGTTDAPDRPGGKLYDFLQQHPSGTLLPRKAATKSNAG